ncbi:MAG TPA: S41 family peptidase [Chitinophagaceae bacterium]|jgi:hypothetical protein|nr:S41 family peptidase [Chitinophagaceae bacterium]
MRKNFISSPARPFLYRIPARLLSLLALLALLMPAGAKAQKTDSVRVFVDSALNILQHRSLFARPLNWAVIRDSAHRMAAHATTYAEAAPAVQFAFNLLGDKHGWLVLEGKEYTNPFLLRDNSRINEATRAVITKPGIRKAVLGKDIAYLNIPFFGGQTGPKMNDFAQRLQDSLCAAVNKNTKGLVIDLRLNGGGNLFPMLVGVANVIGNGKWTESVNSLGEKDGELVLKDYSVTLLDTIVVKLTRMCGDHTRLPLTVLIGPATGSSGEQLAIVLGQRKGAVLVGEPTAGYVTDNNGFRLPGRENGIVIGESYTRDAKGQVYLKDVVPAIPVPGGDDFGNLEKDAKVQAAIRWIRNGK